MDDSSLDTQISDLKTLVDKLQSQKNALLKDLDQIEERFEKTNGLYRKYFPYIIDLIVEANSPFSPVLKDLSTALKKGSPLGRIEYIFKQIQEAILRESPEPEIGKKEGRSFLSGLFKPAPQAVNPLTDIKRSYIDILNRLKEVLDQGYLARLNALSEKLNSISDMQEIVFLRDDLFSLLLTYIAEVGADREKIAAFIQEIVRRILDIEAGIAQSYANVGEVTRSSEGFGRLVNTEMGSLKNSLAVSQSLDELKSRVTETLATIESALKKKVAKDKAFKEIAERNSQNFKAGFARLRKELDDATSHSKALEKKLNLDPLTGAYNRRAYNKRIEDEMERFLRYGTGFSLLIIDADHFKNVNDTYGHAIGDKCLQEIIRRTAPHIRKSDMLARYGGEEFVVIMPETDGAGALSVAEKIRSTIEKIEFIYKEDTVRVTVSIGASQVRAGDKTHGEVFDRADTAVYQAKEGGRNKVVLN